VADLEDLLERAKTARQPDDLFRVWRRVSPGFTRELRMEDKGLMSKMVHAVGGSEHTPRAARALAWSAFHWDEFRSRVEALDGQKGPGAPNLAFILRHFEVAVDMAEEPTTKSGQISKSREKPYLEPVAEMTQEERDEYIRSLEED
jgi:hypothetical protein